MHGGGKLPYLQLILTRREFPVDEFQRLPAVVGDPADIPLVTTAGAFRHPLAPAAAVTRGQAAARSGEDGHRPRFRHHRPADEEVDREGGTEPNAVEGAGAAAAEGEGEGGRGGRAAADGGEEKAVAGKFDADEKGAEKPLAVMQPDRNQRRSAIVEFVGKIDADRQPGDIFPAEDTGNGHKTEKRRNQEVQEVVAGIDGGKPEEQGHADVKRPGPGQAQASGTGTSLSSDRSTSSLLTASFSGRRISRCAPTATATSLTSSGATNSRPSR